MKKTQLILTMLTNLLLLSSLNAAKYIQINAKNFDLYLYQKQPILLEKNGSNQFVLDKKIVLSNGVIKKKYKQYYQGVPVYSASLTSTETKGREHRWWGNMLLDIPQDIKTFKPKISTIEILQKAKQFMHISLPSTTTLDKVDLYIKQNPTTHIAELIYLVSFNITGKNPQRPYFIFNAHTGKLIHHWNGLTTKHAFGPGGNEKTGQYIYGTDFTPLNVSETCKMKNTEVETYNMNHRETGGTIFKFICPTNNYKKINGAYSPLNDAHFFGSVVYDMYKIWYNMDPLNMVLKMRVHYGQDYENAYWDGEQMTFGDGGVQLYPLTVLDVTGHEISHGVTEKNSNLVYEYQAGAINESFSDMAGETAEYYLKSQVGKTNDWLVGSAIIKGPAGLALRYFKDPTADGESIDNASNYTDQMDVHYTSGVFNKAFYNLATQPNWDIKKAFEVFLTANRIYWTSDATFDSAACGVAKAANDLTYPVEDVVISFKDVGVDANCITPTPDPTEIELKNGQIISQIQLLQGQERQYFIVIPKLDRYPFIYKYLNVALNDTYENAKDAAELYVRYDDQTLSNTWYKMGFKDENFYIALPSPGTYHILLKGKKKASLNLQAYYMKY